MQIKCPSCGSPNPEGNRFCGDCGNRLLVYLHRSDTVKAAAERRQLTVMFCDLIDSTALASRLDPEDLRHVYHVYRNRCAEIVSAYAGTVFGYSGDGILVYFGYPEVHEDDAQRAIRAALEMAEVVPQLHPLDETLQVRIGIATGSVVVGGAKDSEVLEARSAVGEPPNLAARLQAIAAPNTIVIAAATRRLGGELFEYEDLGTHWLKGFPEPQRAWRVAGLRKIESRFHGLQSAQLTSIVGRERELQELVGCWLSASEQSGRVALIVGDAGIGKSRVIQELRNAIKRDDYPRYTCQCWAHHQNSAFYPIIELLERVLDCGREKSAEERIQAMKSSLTQGGLDPSEWIPLIAPLLGVMVPEEVPATGLSPEVMKQMTLQALVRMVLGHAGPGPVLFVMEDAHWIDPSTAEFLSLLVSRVAEQRVLVLVSGRPEFNPSWQSGAHVLRIDLSPLTNDQTRSMATAIVGGKALPLEVLDQIAQRADGIPLFIEELTRLLVDSGVLVDAGDRFSVPANWNQAGTIPTTLQDLLLARLGWLSWEQSIAHLAAVLGRRFEYHLIRTMWQDDEELLKRGLEHLVQIGLLSRGRQQSNPVFMFRHALMQDAAYNAVLKSLRTQLHRLVASKLEAHFPEIVQNQPDLVAHHFELAGHHYEAISHLIKAGRRCSDRSEHLEAINHIRKALELLALLPDERQRIGIELELLMILTNPLLRTRGYGSPELEGVLKRARELCGALGNAPQLLSVLVGLALFHTARAELRLGRELGEQVLDISSAMADPTIDLLAHRILGSAAFWQGDLAQAREYLERGASLYDLATHRHLAHRYFVDPGVVCLSTLGLDLWMLGDPEKGAESVAEGIQLARALSHPFTLGFALVYACSVHQLSYHLDTALQLTEETIALSRKHAFPQGTGWASAVRGWVLAKQGDIDDGLRHLERGIGEWRRTGTVLIMPYFLTLMADVYRMRGEPQAGLALVRDGIEMIEKTGERWWEAELYRVRGELRWMEAGAHCADAEVDFRTALAMARNRGAKPLEIRAINSLARMLDAEGRRSEAIPLLEGIRGAADRVIAPDGLEAKELLATMTR